MVNVTNRLEIPPVSSAYCAVSWWLDSTAKRYLEMVSECLKSGARFGVCLIREGSETGKAAMFHKTGTPGSISYWKILPDGMLGGLPCWVNSVFRSMPAMCKRTG